MIRLPLRLVMLVIKLASKIIKPHSFKLIRLMI